MFDTKSQSPGRIALTIAITSCIFVAGLLIVTGNNTTVILVGTSFFFLLSYFFPKFLIEKYFSRKIKLIYKFINQTKASKREEFFLNKILPKKILDEVS